MRIDFPAARHQFAAGVMLAFLAVQAPFVGAAVQVAPKHLIILRPGLDTVWGSYIFALQNDATVPSPFKGKVMLPKETADFQAQEGLTPEEVTLSDSGITVEKNVDAGVQVLGIGFKVSASLGRSTMTFTTVSPLDSLSVLIPKTGTAVGVESDLLSIGSSDASPDPEYVAYTNKAPIPAGQTFTVSVSGIPEGRGRSWAVAAGVMALLVIGGGSLAWRTRPRLKEDAGMAFMIG